MSFKEGRPEPVSGHFNPTDVKNNKHGRFKGTQPLISPEGFWQVANLSKPLCVCACVWGRTGGGMEGKCSTMEVSSLSHHLPKELKQPELLSAPVAKPKQAGSLNLPAAPTQRLNLTFSSPSSDCSQPVFSLVMNRILLSFLSRESHNTVSIPVVF